MLWIEVVLLLAAFFAGTNQLMIGITLMAFVGVAWVAVAGDPTLQAAVAVGIVWLLLIGGMTSAVRIPRPHPATDLAKLTRDTLIVPQIVWHAGFVALAAVCLWKGGQALLGF